MHALKFRFSLVGRVGFFGVRLNRSCSAQEKNPMRLSLFSFGNHRRSLQWLLIASAFLLAVLLSVQSAFGDNLYGSIRGTVKTRPEPW
jgi:hypothetical protein